MLKFSGRSPEADAAKGYLDVHISLATPAVAHHWLVYASQGHLQNIANVNTLGGMTFYRLPFWHYTTPLAAKRRQEAEARRWLLLSTFSWPVQLGSVTIEQADQNGAKGSYEVTVNGYQTSGAFSAKACPAMAPAIDLAAVGLGYPLLSSDSVRRPSCQP